MARTGISELLTESRQRGLFAALAIYIVGAWVVLQVAALAFPGWGIPESAIRYVWMGAILLFPVAAVFGWRYDLTTEGLRRTFVSGGSVSSAQLGRPDYGLLCALATITAATTFFVVAEVLSTRQFDAPAIAANAPENSIAVLAFVNMSDDEKNEYFSDGISEELLNELARMPELHVAARTSSFHFKGRNESVQRMGAALGVRNLLEGSVRKQGDFVRITAQLVDAENGFHRWSGTYDRKLDDIFSVQTEIATAIAETLKLQLLDRDLERLDIALTDNVEAYDLYLRGVALQKSRLTSDLDESSELLQQAIVLDPGFAKAHAALAYTFLLQPFFGPVTNTQATALAEPLLHRALELEPEMEDAYASLGLLMSMRQRYEESGEYFEQALRINPNYFQALVNYGLSLVFQSRLKEASAKYLRAQTLDPLNANLNKNLGLLLILMGQFEDGRHFVQNAIDIDPDSANAKASLINWMANYGELAAALQLGRESLSLHPGHPHVIGAMIRTYLLLDERDAAFEQLVELRAVEPGSFMSRYQEEWLHFTSGDSAAYLAFAESELQLIDANVGDPLDFSDRIRAHRFGRALLMQGDYQRAADVLHWAAGGDAGIAETTYDMVNFLKYLAFAYLQTDRDAEARELLKQSLILITEAHDNGWATPFLFVRLAEVQFLMGDTDSAIANLWLAVDKGWCDIGWLRNAILLQGLDDNAEAMRIEQAIEDKVAAQRDLIAGARDLRSAVEPPGAAFREAWYGEVLAGTARTVSVAVAATPSGNIPGEFPDGRESFFVND